MLELIFFCVPFKLITGSINGGYIHHKIRSDLTTLSLSSNATKYESIAPHQDYVESRTIAHVRDDEKLFFVYISF